MLMQPGARLGPVAGNRHHEARGEAGIHSSSGLKTDGEPVPIIDEPDVDVRAVRGGVVPQDRVAGKAVAAGDRARDRRLAEREIRDRNAVESLPGEVGIAGEERERVYAKIARSVRGPILSDTQVEDRIRELQIIE